MTYFKIGNNDYSKYVNSLKPSTTNNYTAQQNAAGDTVVDYINKKRIIEVGIIPLDADAMANLMTDIEAFNVSISYLNPKTKTLENDVNCIVASHEPDYYTIQDNNVMFKAFTLTFTEL